MPTVPLWLKACMWIAFLTILGAWYWLVKSAVYDWFPDWLNDVLFTVMVGALAYYFGYERGSAGRKKLGRGRLSRRAD